jgi:hypothetical protein
MVSATRGWGTALDEGWLKDDQVRWAVPLLKYALTFALQLRESVVNLSQIYA